MHLVQRPSRTTQWITAVAMGTLMSCAFAADDKTAAAQPELPAPNPAAEQALQKHFQSIFAAFEGKSAMPAASNFTDDFTKKVTMDQMKQVFDQVKKSVGNCRIAGQIPSPISYVGSYLLQCDKAFVPMDIAVEEKAPYRVHSLLIRPGYAKL